jgi:hypothetical protein
MDLSLTSDLKNAPPRPIADRICKCGCGHSFTPNRRDQIYYNSQHANYGYNHGGRKVKTKNRVKEEKILLKNDNILERHYKMNTEKEVVCYYDVLKADGFNFAYNIGQAEKDSEVMWYSYSYYYTIVKTEPKQVKIYKR